MKCLVIILKTESSCTDNYHSSNRTVLSKKKMFHLCLHFLPVIIFEFNEFITLFLKIALDYLLRM